MARSSLFFWTELGFLLGAALVGLLIGSLVTLGQNLFGDEEVEDEGPSLD